jgi:hypothetical protein
MLERLSKRFVDFSMQAIMVGFVAGWVCALESDRLLGSSRGWKKVM